MVVAAAMVQAATKKKSPRRVVYLMRGVPGSGKSFTAKKLAGKKGLVCETDSFFGPPGKQYRFIKRLVPAARISNMKQFLYGLAESISPIVVDRGNSNGRRTRWYAVTARLFGYNVKFAEPTSPWWKQIKKMLTGKSAWSFSTLEGWVCDLAKRQEGTHQVSKRAIWRSMVRWKATLKIEDLLKGNNLEK